jgi:hypothetical protein
MPAFAHLRHSRRIFALTQRSPPLRALPRLICGAKGQPPAHSIHSDLGRLARAPQRNLSLAACWGRGCGRIVQHKILPASPAHRQCLQLGCAHRVAQRRSRRTALLRGYLMPVTRNAAGFVPSVPEFAAAQFPAQRSPSDKRGLRNLRTHPMPTQGQQTQGLSGQLSAAHRQSLRLQDGPFFAWKCRQNRTCGGGNANSIAVCTRAS